MSGAASATLVYDGDGNRVKATLGGVTTAYVGNYFEWTGSTSTMKKYYYAEGARVAVREGSSTLYYILTDHGYPADSGYPQDSLAPLPSPSTAPAGCDLLLLWRVCSIL